ncbi:unnamed protein product [Zymoseptoria tritici ST99CH_1A5]|uniref:Chitin-binding type-4 domain-containing protein n=1 Tax=Zymoseptoria tritici ST99CH_1A5 TaxID=1276529 RepID=A0A1Y6LCW9_ZYMTR|nr:unnamed protein product [Zymoseptoria tritici ST99CH_1A5]
MQTHIALMSAFAFLPQIFGHMMLDYPAPFNATNNPHRVTEPDPYLQYPYDCCGLENRWSYPCRGYEKLLGTLEGAPTATWAAGSTQNWNITGIGNHYGGSCQVGFSTDKGKSFHVATSYEGNCPHRDAGNGPDGQEFEFTVPSDVAAGVHLFAWIWYNREQELNMNCAAVEITSSGMSAPSYSTSTSSAVYGSASTAAEPSSAADECKTADGCSCTCESPVNISTCTCTCPARSYTARDTHNHAHDRRASPAAIRDTSSAFVAFADRPLMFVADNGNDCKTPKNTGELMFPDPGPDVVRGDGVYPLELPTGECSASGMLAKQAYTGIK